MNFLTALLLRGRHKPLHKGPQHLSYATDCRSERPLPKSGFSPPFPVRFCRYGAPKVFDPKYLANRWEFHKKSLLYTSLRPLQIPLPTIPILLPVWGQSPSLQKKICFIVFLQRVSIDCYAERCTSHSKSVRPSVRPSVRLSVCLSVRHTLALCQNDSSYDHGVFTGG